MDKERAIRRLEDERSDQAQFVDKWEHASIGKEYEKYINEGRAAIEAIDLAIEALQREIDYGQGEEVDYCNNCPYISYNNEDCISRQLAIEEIKNATTITGWNTYASQEEIVDDVERELRRLFVGAIESLPPVTPTERTGEWVEREDWNGDNYYDCSVCDESFVLIDGTPSMNLYHYCPNCGARMEGGAE